MDGVVPPKKETRGRPRISYEHKDHVCFKYQGKVYTMFRDGDENGRHLVGGLWKDPEFCRIYGRLLNRIRPKAPPKNPGQRKRLDMDLCQICQCKMKSREHHNETKKHQTNVEKNELIRKQALDYLSSCGYEVSNPTEPVV